MEWYNGSVAEAVATAKRNSKLFLVYIEGTDDMSKEMTNTYNDAVVAQKLSTNNIVAIKLTANSVPFRQFCAIYPVLIIPSSYFIGVNGAPIEIITGSLVPTEFAAKIEKIFGIHENFSRTAKEAAMSKPSSSKESEPPSVPLEVKSVDPNQPSTSKASEEELNKAPLEERLERAKVLLETKKQIKEEEEKKKEKDLELERRNAGKALQKMKQTQQDNELKEWAINRAKEKEEERIAREKVRALIAQDRAERAARFQQHKDDEREKIAKAREEQERVARAAAALNSNEARIQFRLPDGSSTNHVFSANMCLDDVRAYVRQEVRPPFSNFSLCTTFPRRHFTRSNYSESLRDLQLAPSAVLLILPDQSVTNTSGSGSFWSTVFWTLMSPLVYTWRTITSLFSSGTPEQTSPPPQEPSTSRRTEQDRTSEQSRSPSRGARRKDASFVRQEGNIYRLSNQSDDGENNTWNGNSTQQM